MTGANLESVILQGSLLPRTNLLGQVGIAVHTLSPADTRLSPQHWLGTAGCNSRAGLVRFTLAQADYELGHGGNERFALGALNPRPSYPHAHHTHHSHESSAASSALLTAILRMPAWRPGGVQQVPLACASFWLGLHCPVQICAHCLLCTLGPMYSLQYAAVCVCVSCGPHTCRCHSSLPRGISPFLPRTARATLL